jgi:hypothetical protein
MNTDKGKKCFSSAYLSIQALELTRLSLLWAQEFFSLGNDKMFAALSGQRPRTDTSVIPQTLFACIT